MTPTSHDLAPIEAGTVYPLPIFCQRTGLERASLRRMRANGFRVLRVGKRSYVIGGDFLRYIDEHADRVLA
jgi:hypothetical protein